MAGIRYSAHGTTVTVNSVAVEGITSIAIGGGSAGEAETTDSDSGGIREYVRGLQDRGQLTLEMRHYPAEAGQANLRTLQAAGTTVPVVVTLPASATDDATTATLSFNAFVQTFDYNLPTAEDAAATVTAVLRVSGNIVEAAA